MGAILGVRNYCRSSEPGGKTGLTPLMSAALIALLAFSFVIFSAGASFALNTTTVGTISAYADNSSGTAIVVKAPYTDDDNADNQITVQWKLCTDGSYATPPTNTAGPTTHPASPLVTTITQYNASALTANTCYDVQVTYTDADNSPTTTTQQIMIDSTWDNTLLHNSNRFYNFTGGTPSTKWSGSWGVPGGQYGQFVCETCHTKSTTNIKRIQTAITAPTGSFPGGAVTFLSAVAGSSDFGDDNGGHATSMKVCEVCHSQNKYHNYNTANNTGGILTHNNQADCTTCHSHRNGFFPVGGACDSCHGDPPTVAAYGGPNGLVGSYGSGDTGILGSGNPPAGIGAHATHVTTRGMACDVCHKGSTMPSTDNIIEMGFSVDSTTFPGWGVTAVTTGTTSLHQPNSPFSISGYTGTTVNILTGADYSDTCSLYCHGSTLTGGSLTTPSWTGTNQAACGTCHAAGSGFGGAPTAGSHTTHAGTVGLACTTCHPDNGDIADPDRTHVNGSVSWAIDQADPRTTGGTYTPGIAGTTGPGATGQTNNLAPSATYGSCTNIYCHSTIQGAGGVGAPGSYSSPQWGVSTMTCGSCHVNMSTDATGTGSHALHANTAGNGKYSCDVCHGTGYSATTVVYPTHANGSINLSFTGLAAGGSYNGGVTSITPGTAYGTCSSIQCHGNGTMTWGNNTATPTCEKCHGSANTAQTSSTFMVTDRTTAGAVSTAHVAHLASTLTSYIACNECHTTFTDPTGVNDPGHIDHALPALVPLAGTLANTNPRSVAGTPTYTPATKTCSNVYCHDGSRFPDYDAGGNNTTPSFDDTTYLNGTAAHDCAQCHGYPPASHATSGYGTNCTGCHTHVNATNDGFTDPSKHCDGTVEVNVDNCNGCHSTASLSARHALHSDPDYFLAGKALSTSDYGNLTWWYSVEYVNGWPKFACGYCHPQSSATHRNGVRNLNFDPGDTGAAGTVKALNAATQAYTQTQGVSVTCSSVYCHSNGYDSGLGYKYQTTPDWYTTATPPTTFAEQGITDECDACHGNSPNNDSTTTNRVPGSPAHGIHVVALHYKGDGSGLTMNSAIYSGTTGLIPSAAAPGTNAAHGDPLYSTTINCYICHNSTVTMAANDLNTVCVTCHYSPGGATLEGTMTLDAAGTTHINGTPDIVFANTTMKIRAQMRDNITLWAELNENWTRNNGYKAGATSYDSANKSLNAASYNSGTKTCSNVACHNQDALGTRTIQWTDTGNANICYNCHRRFPL